ncbi:hypothetical protein SNE40_023297 [Patella caerulea]|uniref:Transmembrane protein 177 n=1 Tax=Patella caerulea TaxID=87958 RepID=A0AAN8FY81_PATCE
MSNILRIENLCTTVLAGGIYFISFYRGTLGLNKFKESKQYYNNDIVVPVDDQLKSIIKKPEPSKSYFDRKQETEIFTVSGIDIISRGSISSVWGSIIGIPINLNCKSVTDLEKEKITIDNQEINMDSPQGKQLGPLMIFSEKAKLFAISRELSKINDGLAFHEENMVAPISLILGSMINYVLHEKLRFRTRLAYRLLVYGFVGLCYIRIREGMKFHKELDGDKHAVNQSLELVEGGIEFIDKLIEQNKTVPTVLGSDERPLYSYVIYGNDYNSWKTPETFLKIRRDALLKLQKELIEKNEKEIQENATGSPSVV